MISSEYKPYPIYSPSEVEWLGKIPESWTVSKIKYLAPFQVGWTPSTKNDANFEGENLWANISDLKGSVLLDTAKKISDTAAKESSMAITPAGALMYSFKLSVGAVAFAGKDMYTNEAIASFLHDAKLPLKYLYYVLPKFVIENASTNIYGARILNQELISNAVLLAPPYADAEAIASFLDHETAKIDTLIEEQKTLIRLLQEKRQAVISHAVTKGLNHDVQLKDSGVEWLGQVPEHWVVSSIKYVVSPQKDAMVDGPFGSSVNTDTDYIDEGVPVVRTVNITNNGFSHNNLKFMRREKYIQLKRHSVAVGDVLFSKVGTIGNACTLPASVPEAILSTTGSCKITLDFKKYLAEYLVFVIQSMNEELMQIANANVQPFLNMSNIKNLRIPLPPLEEQKEILSKLKSRLNMLEGVLREATISEQLLLERRTALISAAVTGKIDVRDWTPPAPQKEHQSKAVEAA